MGQVTAVISDFGGVLTSPLADAFGAFERRTGVSPAMLGTAMAAITVARGTNPLVDLEVGRLTVTEFLATLGAELEGRMGHPVELSDFGQTYFAALEANEPMVDYLRGLRERGYKLAICTNNVREWSTLWRAMVPIEELFEVVVDSSEVGARKPDPHIYHLTLEELDVSAEAAVFIDDLEINCTAARQLGMRAVWFQTTDQAIAEIDAALA